MSHALVSRRFHVHLDDGMYDGQITVRPNFPEVEPASYLARAAAQDTAIPFFAGDTVRNGSCNTAIQVFRDQTVDIVIKLKVVRHGCI